MSNVMNIRRQQGFTLIELVIASSLSVFLSLMVAAAYQANQRSYQYQTSINTMHESSRYIAQTMIARLTAADVDVAGGATLIVADLDGDDTGAAADDSLMITYTVTGDTARLCSSSGTSANPTVLYSLAAGSNGEDSLHCSSTSQALPPAAPGQELVAEVEHLRVLYGENTDDADGLTSIDEWVGWNDVTNENDILAIQVGFMVRSEAPFTADLSDQVYNLLDIPLTKNDGRLRQVYSFTVALTPRIPAHEEP